MASVVPISRPVPDHQSRVDAIQAQVRSEGPSRHPGLFKPPPRRPSPSKSTLDHRISEELETIRRHLDLLGSVLVDDPALVRRYATELQSVDLVNQLLGHLSRVIAAEEKDLAVEQIGLQDLRARLQRRPLRPLQP